MSTFCAHTRTSKESSRPCGKALFCAGVNQSFTSYLLRGTPHDSYVLHVSYVCVPGAAWTTTKRLSLDQFQIDPRLLDATLELKIALGTASRGKEADDDPYKVTYCRGLWGPYAFDDGYKTFAKCVLPRHTGAVQPLWADNTASYYWGPAAGFVRKNSATGWR